MEKIRKIASVIPYVIPRWMVRLYHWIQRYTRRIPVGLMNFKNWRRLTPISHQFGYDRGLPIARYYIERFLLTYASNIKGQVLEIHDNDYTRKFGGDRVTKSDVLHVEEGNPLATIVADLTSANHIPSGTFNCIIFTQTLHFIYNVRAAIQTLYRILKPGGVLLATFSGISPISRTDMDRWGDYWRFTTLSVQLLFEEVFPADNIKVQAHGNVLTAISYLHGLAAEELTKQELSYHDPNYQLLITLKAVKPT